MSKLSDRQLRNEWLVNSAPFTLVSVHRAKEMASVARYNEWLAQGFTQCVIDRHGYTWITFDVKQSANAQEVVDNLNDEAALAAMVHGTHAEKIVM